MNEISRYLGLVETIGRIQHVTFRPTYGNDKDPILTIALSDTPLDIAREVAFVVVRRLQVPSAPRTQEFVENVAADSLRHLIH